MIPIDFSKYFNPIFSEQVSVGIACNSPEKAGATDRAMIELVTRGGFSLDDLR